MKISNYSTFSSIDLFGKYDEMTTVKRNRVTQDWLILELDHDGESSLIKFLGSIEKMSEPVRSLWIRG